MTKTGDALLIFSTHGKKTVVNHCPPEFGITRSVALHLKFTSAFSAARRLEILDVLSLSITKRVKHRNQSALLLEMCHFYIRSASFHISVPSRQTWRYFIVSLTSHNKDQCLIHTRAHRERIQPTALVVEGEGEQEREKLECRIQT